MATSRNYLVPACDTDLAVKALTLVSAEKKTPIGACHSYQKMSWQIFLTADNGSLPLLFNTYARPSACFSASLLVK
jgi:hypothetical protein